MERKSDHGREQSVELLTLPARLAREMIDALQSALPQEGGGLLFGARRGRVWRGERFYPLANRLDHATLYSAEPQGLIDALFTARRCGLELLATLHSHPTGAATPSQRDLAEAYGYEGMCHGIVSFLQDDPVLLFYLYRKHHLEFRYHPVPLVLTNS